MSADSGQLDRPRILFAWELGSNIGHVARDLPLARLCRDSGYEVVMAVPDLRGAATLLANERFTLVQSPRLRPSDRRRAPPINYADMLLHEGYDDPAGLFGAVRGWVGLVELVRPQCLVYNHAPTALLAARLLKLPVMLVGTGFELPPPGPTLPSFRPWQSIGEQALLDVEREVVERINDLLARAGCSRLARLTDLFASEVVQLATFPELDPFGPRVGQSYIGPVFALPTFPPVAWSKPGGRRVFAYLRASIPGVPHLLEALQNLGAEVLCAVPDLPTQWRDRFDRLKWVAHAVDLQSLLPGADLAVTYGAGTIATALLAARPVLLIPQVVEQYLAGLALERTGAGFMIREDRSVSTCTSILQTLLGEERPRQAAAAFATRHGTYCHAEAAQYQLAALRGMSSARGAVAVRP